MAGLAAAGALVVATGSLPGDAAREVALTSGGPVLTPARSGQFGAPMVLPAVCTA